MDNLEQQLKEGLVQQTYEEVKEMYQKPEVRQILFEVLGGVADAMQESLLDQVKSEEGEEDAKDFEKDFKRERRKVCTELRRKLYDPAMIEQLARQSAQNAYQNPAEQFSQLEAQLSQFGFSEENTAKVKAALQDLTSSAKNLQQYVFERLLEVAKIEGLEKALQKETRYAVTRELYPTREAYEAEVEKAFAGLSKFTGALRDAALGDDSEGDLFMRTLVEKIMVGMVEKAVDTTRKLGKPLQEEQLNKIYGPTQ